MKVLAHKKQYIGLMYIAVTVFGIALFFIDNNWLAGTVITIPSVIISIQYYMQPKDIISIGTNNNLYLPRGVEINLRNINDVSYRRASARFIQYRWGTVIIYTNDKTYRCRYVADCEDAALQLKTALYMYKNNNLEEETNIF